MKYTYHTDCHELWATAAATPDLPFQLQLRRESAQIFENAFIISNAGQLNAPVVILPDLSAHLVVHYMVDGGIHIGLIGPRTTARFINRQQRSKTLIFRFHPAALAVFLPFPVSDLTDRSIDLPTLIGTERATALLEDGHGDKPLRVLNQLMTLLETGNARTGPANTSISEHFMKIYRFTTQEKKVSSFARQMGLSERYLHKNLKAQTGISPKMALRILRFRESLINRHQQRRASWSGIAAASGYFDQSHMIDEYQRFLGDSPDRFFFGR